MYLGSVLTVKAVRQKSQPSASNTPANINKGEIANHYGNTGQNSTVVNDKVSKQCVSHMCNGQSPKVRGNNENNSVESNIFVHTNRFQPLSDIDLNTVNNCHSVEVSTVVENVGCKNTCDKPVAKGKSSTTVLKGKKKNSLDFNCNNVLDRGHVKSRKQTEHTVENRTVPLHTEYKEMSNIEQVV